jgi:hypothetical protein
MPTGADDPGAARHHAKSAQVVSVLVRLSSWFLMENGKHLVDGAAGFLLDAGGVES